MIKRVLLTLLAFVVASIFVTLWRKYVPLNLLSGAVMAGIGAGIVFGTWKWSAGEKTK